MLQPEGAKQLDPSLFSSNWRRSKVLISRKVIYLRPAMGLAGYHDNAKGRNTSRQCILLIQYLKEETENTSSKHAAGH